MGDVLDKGLLRKFLLIIAVTSGIPLFAGYVLGDGYSGLIGLWIVLIGIFVCLLTIVHEKAMQVDIVEE